MRGGGRKEGGWELSYMKQRLMRRPYTCDKIDSSLIDDADKPLLTNYKQMITHSRLQLIEQRYLEFQMDSDLFISATLSFKGQGRN